MARYSASNIQTDLIENVIHEFGLLNGLVDIKVCAINEIWSGLKFVYRLRIDDLFPIGRI